MGDRYGKRDTGAWIEDTGVVRRLLHDDEADERHQRFVVAIGTGQTLLLAHNLELSDRVPLGLGDRVHFRGLYEHNERGGLVHWTHRDPLDDEPGGYIRFRKRRYE